MRDLEKNYELKKVIKEKEFLYGELKSLLLTNELCKKIKSDLIIATKKELELLEI